MRVISASRRTDIAAFYSEWFMNRVRAGWCEWRNPFGGQTQRVSLRPEDVIAIVFWTRHPTPLEPHLEWLRQEGYRFYFHITINGYPKELESHSPPVGRAIEAFRRLSDRISPRFVEWRYDPIVISDRTPPAYHVERFDNLSRRLEGATTRCYFSFVDYYGKTSRNLAKLDGIRFTDPEGEARAGLARELSAVAKSRNMTMYSCCEAGLAFGGIERSRCVDRDLISALRPDLELKLKAVPTREECGCAASTDIGAYDTCVFGCAYCYATQSRQAALAQLRAHSPDHAMLRNHRQTG